MATKFDTYGIPHIYSDEVVSAENIIDIYIATKDEAKKNFEIIKNLTNIYKGNQADSIPDTQRAADEKLVANYTKIFIDTVVSITLNKAITYVSRGNNEAYKNDIDKITEYMNDEGEHATNIATCTDMIVDGIGYQYCLQQRYGDPTPSSPFTVGRFDNECTYVVESNDIGNKVIAAFHIGNITKADKTKVERITAFDSINKYIFETDTNSLKGYSFVKVKVADANGQLVEQEAITPHDLPYNPIQVFENDVYRLSSVQDLWGLQRSLNISISNYNNDVLLKINQLLAIIGSDLDQETIEKMKKDNVLNMAEGDAKFIASQIDNRLVDFIGNTIEMMCLISGCPSQNSGRAETGKAVETQNGHTIANFNSNRREQAFYKPKRQQLANAIAILKRTRIITSNIREKDIEIKFDKNRLISISENVINLRTLINEIKVDPYKALSVCPIFEDNQSVAVGIIANQEKERKFEIEKSQAKKIENGESENARVRENTVS